MFKEPEDGEGAASGEMINEVIKQIQRMEKSFSVRISAVESYSTKFVEINDNINDLNDNMTRALAPKGPTITQEDVDSWNDGLDKLKALEDQLKGLRKEINLMDGTKIKADILQLFKITQKMVNEDDISSMKDDMRRMKSEMADCNYDVAACKDIITKVEKSIDASQKENTQNINLLRQRMDAHDQKFASIKKNMELLDSKNKNSSKTASLNQNPGLAVQVIQDLETELNKLKEDHENLKGKQDKDTKQIFGELDDKASKQDLVDLESRLIQQLSDLATQMREMFPDKEAVRKKLRDLSDKIK